MTGSGEDGCCQFRPVVGFILLSRDVQPEMLDVYIDYYTVHGSATVKKLGSVLHATIKHLFLQSILIYSLTLMTEVRPLLWHSVFT